MRNILLSLIIVAILLIPGSCRKNGSKNLLVPGLQETPVMVFYDNDEATDVYTEEYLYALGELGKIDLKGISTTTSVEPFNKYVREKGYWRMHTDRMEGIQVTEETGFMDLPPVYQGPLGHIHEPASGRIEDTEPKYSEAALALVSMVQQLDPGETIFVLAGGPLTMVADAYLLDSTITEHLVIGWVGGNIDDVPDYNAWADPWSAYICMKKYRMILVPFVLQECPDVTREIIAEKLPDSPLTRWMLGKNHHVLSGSQKGHDVDVPPIIAVLYSDYVLKSYRAAVTGWKKTGFEEIMYEVPAIETRPDGNLYLIEERDGERGTEIYWSDMQAAFAQLDNTTGNE